MRTQASVEACPVFIASQVLGKKWMIIVLQVLMTDSNLVGMRFSEILREISWVSPKVLTQRLRELEQQSLVQREVEDEATPPRVTYTLTRKGEDLKPALAAMQAWGIKHGGSSVADCTGQGFSECRSCSIGE